MEPRWTNGAERRKSRRSQLIGSPLILLTVSMGGAFACASTTDIERGLQYDGSVERAGDLLRTEFFVTNRSGESIRLTHSCVSGTSGSALRVHDASGVRWQSQMPTPGETCGLYLAVLDLEPGESGRITRSHELPAILGDSLALGVYQLTLVPSFDQNVPLVEIDLGEMMLDQ